MAIVIRRANDRDVEVLLPAFMAMERHYNGGNAVSEDVADARLANALSNSKGVMLAAFDDGEVLGFLSMFELFPGHALQPVWFMKELYVCEAARSRGVGAALIRCGAKIVTDNGGSRLDFTTGRDNLGAQKFYARIGAKEVPALFLRFDEAALSRLAEEGIEDLPA